MACSHQPNFYLCCYRLVTTANDVTVILLGFSLLMLNVSVDEGFNFRTVVKKSHFIARKSTWSQQLLHLFPGEGMAEMDCVLVICDLYNVWLG